MRNSLWLSILLAVFFRAIQGSFADHVDLPRRSESSNSHTVNLTFSGTDHRLGVKLGGKEYTLRVDMSGSDLMVYGPVPNAVDLNIPFRLQTISGPLTGKVKSADLEVAGFTLPNQVFVEIDSSDSSHDQPGTFGVGPHSGSLISCLLKSSAGDSVLQRILCDNNDLPQPNYLTFLLTRMDGTTPQSQMTIGEILPAYHDLLKQPKNALTVAKTAGAGQAHFTMQLGANGMIGPDGHPVHSDSLLMAVETAFSVSVLPDEIVKALYSNANQVPFRSGFAYNMSSGTEVHLSMEMTGPPSQSIFLNPLDVTALGKDGDGRLVTIGTFVPASAVPELESLGVHGAFGQSFLRNVYFGVNYGSCDGHDTGAFIHFLPTTDAAKAHNDFSQQRLNHTTTKTALGTELLEENDSKSSQDKKSGPLAKYKIPILATIVGVAVLVVIISAVSKRRKQAYRGLNEPAPDGDPGMQSVEGYNAGLQYTDTRYNSGSQYANSGNNAGLHYANSGNNAGLRYPDTRHSDELPLPYPGSGHGHHAGSQYADPWTPQR